MTKKNEAFLFISECSLSYLKIAQTSEMTKENEVFLFISECSLSYLKIAQTSEMTKKIAQTSEMTKENEKNSPPLAPSQGGRTANPMH